MANARHVSHQRLGPELWKKTITDQRRSGLSQAEFCHQQGLSLSTFQRWRARLAETAEDSPVQPSSSALGLELPLAGCFRAPARQHERIRGFSAAHCGGLR